jgi:hypothetical protein
MSLSAVLVPEIQNPQYTSNHRDKVSFLARRDGMYSSMAWNLMQSASPEELSAQG